MAKATTDSPGTDVAVPATVGEIALRNDEIVQDFVTWLTERAETTDEDQFAIMAAVISEIMAADNVADALREMSTLSAKDMVGVPLILHGFEVRQGDFEESSLGFYAAMTVSRPGVEGSRILTCGGMKVMVRLRKLADLGEWPQLVTFTAKTTGKGFTVLDLVRPS